MPNVELLTREEYGAILKEALIPVLQRIESLDENQYLDVAQVCQITGYSKYTIYQKTSKGLIPYYKQAGGNKLVFKKGEVMEWMESEGRRKSVKK